MTINEETYVQLAEAFGVKFQRQFDLMIFLIKTKEDLDTFKQTFFSGNITKDLINFQEYKRKQNSVTKAEFLELVKKDKKMALETYFQEPVKKIHEDFLYTTNISYPELFEKKIEQKTKSLLCILQNWEEHVIENVDDGFLLL